MVRVGGRLEAVHAVIHDRRVGPDVALVVHPQRDALVLAAERDGVDDKLVALEELRATRTRGSTA
eukprot:4978272-Prymnesium_polylepis.1